MAESRAERMLGRMRGAQRHEVADISFGFDLGLESPDAAAAPQRPPPGPQQRTTPNSSAKRRRLNSSRPQEQQLASAAPVAGSGGTRSQPPRAAKSSSPYDIPEFSEEERAGATRAGAAPTATGPSPRLGGLTPRQAGVLVEEVGESPADAPGSGSRRRVRISGAVSQSAALQSVIGGSGGRLGGDDEDEDEDPVAVSSPLTRKSRRSEVASARSGRTNLRRVTRVSPTAGEEVDELSPVSAAAAAAAPQQAGGSSPPLGRPSARKSAQRAPSAARSAARRKPQSSPDQGEIDELSPTASIEAATQVPSSSPLVQRSRRQARPAPETSARSNTRKSTRPAAQASSGPDELSPEQAPKAKRGRPRKSQEEVPQQQEPEEREEAEEIGEEEAAARLGRKRPRRSLREPSPELGSQPNNEESTPVSKDRRRQAKPSPAEQKQPRQQQRRRKKKGEGKPQSRKRKAVEVEAGEPVPVQVQRFTRKMHTAENDTDTDILTADIPYSSRAGVNAVDVLSQMCEEIIDLTLEKLHENAANAEDAATKREFRVKLRAVEAFQEELRTRLLEHTIALDTLHALRKRVRAAQKDKLALRDEILRVRAEREQVALRMDATRIRHEAERKEALHHIELSSTMHDIDLVVEKGQAAPELGPAELKVAELNNLELLISRVADQACTKSHGGGVLGHIKGFNEFLERAATVLEGR